MRTMSATAPRRTTVDQTGAYRGLSRNPLWRFLHTLKGSLLLAFLPLLALASAAVSWPLALPHLAAGVAGACLVDLLATRIRRRTWSWPSSALLSGMIVAFILGVEVSWQVTLTVGALASLSKHLLATRRGHVFNPAALALLVSIPVFATTQSWWGTLPDLPWLWTLVLVAVDGFVVDRCNKFPLVLSFLGTYFSLFTLAAFGLLPVSAASADTVAGVFRSPFTNAVLFLALFMLTDPPTSPSRYEDQVWIGVIVAALSCVAQLQGVGQAYLLVGLLAGNLALACLRAARRAA